MKKLAALSLLLVGGCGSQTDPADERAAIEETLLAGLPSNGMAEDKARITSLVQRAMAVALPDADSARYRNVRAGVGGAACGEVAQAAASAPFRPFVVTPEAVAIVGTAAAIKFNDPTDFLADAWVRWCATPEELKRVADDLAHAPKASADDVIPAARNGMAVATPEPVPSAELPAEAVPQTKIDSFSDSVQRPK